MTPNYSDYIVYVDESGDHSLKSINPEYPIFVLVFCIFNIRDYTTNITPALQDFKFKHFGHDMIVLHEHEIRKAKNNFSILTAPENRKIFMPNLNQLIESSRFKIISAIIRKETLKEYLGDLRNPYHLALEYGLSKIFNYLQEKKQTKKQTHIVFESRGKQEDTELKIEFIQAAEKYNMPFKMIIANKQVNSCGLQLADLVAHPIGRHALNPQQPNRAYAIIEKKLYLPHKSEKAWH